MATLDETDLSEPIKLPVDFNVMVMTGRPEMASMISSERTLNAEETRMVVHAMAVLMKTNNRLQEEVRSIRMRTLQSISNIRGAANALASLVDERQVIPEDAE
jgi:hypothetical protein